MSQLSRIVLTDFQRDIAARGVNGGTASICMPPASTPTTLLWLLEKTAK